MTRHELLNGYKQFGIELTIIKEEHTEFSDIFYVSPNSQVSIKNLTSTKEDIKIILGVKELEIVPDYMNKAIKIIVENTNPKSQYASTENIHIEKNTLRIPLGVGLTGTIYHSFIDSPHLLIAGSTGSGKSYFLHHILTSLVENNENVSIVPIDFKGTELTIYQKFVTPVLGKGYGTTLNDAYVILSGAVSLMNYRYAEFKEENITDINMYNNRSGFKLDHIFIVIDELADVMLAYTADKEEKEKLIAVKAFLLQLAQKARGAGIHLILSTQRPTVDVISGHIKANIISRIALKTATSMESKIILDESGAEDLPKGGFLYKSFDSAVSGRVFAVDIKNITERVNAIPYVSLFEYLRMKQKTKQSEQLEDTQQSPKKLSLREQTLIDGIKLIRTFDLEQKASFILSAIELAKKS